MVKNEIALLAVLLLASCAPRFEYRLVPMDGHRAAAQPVTVENASTALGVFDDDAYVAPSGARYDADSPVANVAEALMEVQPRLVSLKTVVGHSAGEYLNLRTDPDLPLGNLFADALRAYGSELFNVPMDFAVTNFGGIRVPLPKGAITMEDISSMFPFKNYVCYVKMKGSGLTGLLEQLAATKAFQATSGATVRVKDHKLVSALVGGEPIDPERVYNVTTIDFLLDGGDKLNIGALAEDVTLSTVLLKEVMMWYVTGMEARGEVIEAKADGRVIMED
ncbi:MAG: 5'-nucleotidase C-terminal domain-containing protein [Bacteroidales bacterium]|nr:5'-nucleotidase C-terminal domain-containing protein [Bacteroidales bacterium]